MSTEKPWVRLASKALTASALADFPTAGKALQALANRHGVDVVPVVLMAWIDTVLITAGHEPGGQPMGVAWMAEETGEIRGADETPPEIRWAGRLFMARTNDDEAQFTALVNSVASDEEWSRNVGAVLNICGAQLRQMGWPPKSTAVTT